MGLVERLIGPNFHPKLEDDNPVWDRTAARVVAVSRC